MGTKLCGELHHERFRGKLGRRQAVSVPGVRPRIFSALSASLDISFSGEP